MDKYKNSKFSYLNDLCGKFYRTALMYSLEEGADILVDKSIIVNGISEARRYLSFKWGSDSTWDKVIKLSRGKLSKANLPSVKKEILNLIEAIPCEIISEDDLIEKVGSSSDTVEGIFIPNDKKVYLKQPPMGYYFQYKIHPDVERFKLLTMHEISHAIYDLLIKKRIYSESIVKSIAVPPGKRFSNNNYIYEPTEIASRMTTVRPKFRIDSGATSGWELANRFFKDLGIPCEKDGQFWKITVDGKFAEGRNPDGTAPVAAWTLESMFKEIHPSGGWDISDLHRLLVPYLKKMKDNGLNVYMWFDLTAMASAMSQIAIRDSKADSKVS